MYWSKSFIPTLKENPQEAESIGHRLLLRAGLARMLMAGAYSYLPLGLRVLENIQKIIRQEMGAIGAAELLLPALQPLELWQKTCRDKALGQVLYNIVDRRGRNLTLGPTHEEVITELVKNNISSYRQLPVILYQIQTKFRDEIRPRFGLIRCCEFIMKDAYSFDTSEEGLNKNYQAAFEAYKKIFFRCGLDTLITEADTGIIGGSLSHEFMVKAPEGEDIVLVCPKCKQAKGFKEGESALCPKCNSAMGKINTIEVGHIFKLGVKYSSCLGANFLDDKGQLQHMLMGCYGIGVSRLISAIIEQNNDANGIIWPKEVAPYQVIILPLDVTNPEIMRAAVDFYKKLVACGIDALLDDRDERAGVKFKDADLLGIPLQVVVGKEAVKNNVLELKARNAQEKTIKPKSEILEQIKSYYA